MDMLDFYRLQFQLRGDGRCLPELGFNVIPSLFVGEYLKPFGKALLTLVSNEDEQLTGQQDGSASGQHHANIKWCRQAIFNLLCFPNQEWRTAAVLAISMAQASKHSAAWLRSFLQELECLTLGAILLPCTYTQQKKAFTQLVKNLQQVAAMFVLKCAFSYCASVVSVFIVCVSVCIHSVWTLQRGVIATLMATMQCL